MQIKLIKKKDNPESKICWDFIEVIEKYLHRSVEVQTSTTKHFYKCVCKVRNDNEETELVDIEWHDLIGVVNAGFYGLASNESPDTPHDNDSCWFSLKDIVLSFSKSQINEATNDESKD